MQKYTVLAGVNGAGLMNGLYLPPFSVAVQLVPYNASVCINSVYLENKYVIQSVTQNTTPELYIFLYCF